jgi:hypothetical protein
MHRPLAGLAACLLASACATTVPLVQRQPAGPTTAKPAEPAARALVDRYLAWRGGSAFEQLQSVYLVADVDYRGMKGVTREWRELGGRTRDELDMELFEQLTVRDGEQGWIKDEGLVSQIGRYELEDARRLKLVEFGNPLRAGPGTRVERLPDEQIDGKTLSVLRVTFGDSDFYDLLIEPSTGALHGRRVRSDAQTQFTRLGDWRLVQGVRMPFRIDSYRPNGKHDWTVRFRFVVLNQRFADQLFARPEIERTLSFASGTRSTGPIKYNPFTGTRIYIPATVNGRKVEVLLDSGADTTVLDKSFAKSIGRDMVGSGVAVGSGGEQESGYAKDVTISIGSMTLKAPTVAVIDLAEVANRIAIPLPVILGKDVFLQSIVDIDPSGPTIAFHDPATFTPPQGATLVPLEPLGSLRVVPVSVEGLPDAPMLFDLGNGGYMSLSPAYWQKHDLLKGRPSSTRSSGAIGGEQINRVATLKTIRFAGITLRDVPAEFSTPNVETDSDREAGNVGMPLLRRFRMMIDFPNNRIFVIPLPGKIDEPFPRDRAGLRAVQDGNKLVVRHVSEGSPAAAAGWQEGDAIVAVDGQPISPEFPSSQLSLWAWQPPGTAVTLTMADGSRRTLRLADYF